MSLERTRRGLTQFQLRQLAGVAQNVICKVENNRYEPKRKDTRQSVLARIASVLDIPADELGRVVAVTLEELNDHSGI
jgi:transcriptional regulator with XRE-family HTH domain